MTETEKALNYYRSAVEQNRPDFVPARVKLKARVTGDGPCAATMAAAGEHDCQSNQWGAISVAATNGRMLGIKPCEFEVIAWRPNEKAQAQPPKASVACNDAVQVS
jgi:hypothetical protein